MPAANIDFDISEDEIIQEYSTKWKLSKARTVKQMVLEFKKLVDGVPEYG